MNKNQENQQYWTGLPSGEQHDHVCKIGRDFIVFDLHDNEPQAFEEHCAAATGRFLRDVDWGEWLRIRATSAAEAVEQFEDAMSQYAYWNNGERNEEEVLDVVLIPFQERPGV